MQESQVAFLAENGVFDQKSKNKEDLVKPIKWGKNVLGKRIREREDSRQEVSRRAIWQEHKEANRGGQDGK